MSTKLQQRPEYLGQLPSEITIESGTWIVDQLPAYSKITVKRDVNAVIVALLNKGWQEKRKIEFHYEDPNAELNFLAIILGSDENQFPIETVSNHHVPYTNGFYYLRSAMFDRSKIDFRGNIIIDKGAHQTDSYLAHHSLMLSKHAHTDTEPCLEIEADDVLAGHAATVGSVDETLLFYLQSRGLNRRQAQDLLIKGFLEADLEKIPNEELKEILAEAIECMIPTSQS